MEVVSCAETIMIFNNVNGSNSKDFFIHPDDFSKKIIAWTR
jgi:hypothetical protein